MQTRPPTMTRILIAFGFAISCFGLALFLWLAFGGAVPLSPEGYRFTVPFKEATQLAAESDVRISGVSVGKVKRVDLNDDGDAEATIELDSAYAPIPADTRAMLRQKTLLGETYVELTPGSEESGSLPEDGDLPPAQVAESVQLDEIFRAFDDRTRASFQAWMQGQAAALRGRGDDLSVAIASLDPFAREASTILRVLDSQEGAVTRLVRDGGTVFGALSERQGQLRGLIESSAEVFATTAARDEELKDTFTVFPTFLRESRETLARLERFAVETDPLVTQLRPVARELTPTATDLGRLAPVLESFFTGLRGTINAAPKGFPALRRLLDDDLPPLLGRLDPFLAQLNPILEVVRMYRHEATAFLANASAATNGFVEQSPEGKPIRNLRTEAPFGPDVLAAFPRRLTYERTNPYMKPLGYADLRSGLPSFETRHCTGGIVATLPDRATTIADPAFNVRTGGDVAAAGDLYDRIRQYTFNGETSTAALPTPPCVEQDPFESIGVGSETSDYLHVREYP